MTNHADERDFEEAHGRSMTDLERAIFKAMQEVPSHRRMYPDLLLPAIMPVIERALETEYLAGRDGAMSYFEAESVVRSLR